MAASPVLLFDLTGRGSVVLLGRDRASFLHGLVTNEVKKLSAGQGCAAAFLSAKGKLLAECVVLCEDERLVLDTPPELAATAEELLRKYLVFNDVTIANETAATHVLHLTAAAEGNGREEEDFLRRVIGPGAGNPLPREPHASVAAQFTFKEDPPGGAIRVVCENRTGVPGFDLRLPSSFSEEIRTAFLSAGAQLESPERLESLRIAAGIPRWGAELTEAVLPDEAGLRERGFISETKGCYVGQEIVARIKTYGHVNRRLVRLQVLGGVPRTGEKIFFEREECGAITSAAAGGASGGAVALAYVKRERAAAGTALTVSSFAGNLPASVAPVAPVPLV
ncbi:MAG: glycine cleavage T C-terminal barrel domain-containing protein [Thermoanaerobaculia bacterium]